MNSSGRRNVGIVILVTFIVLICLGMWQLSGEDAGRRVGANVPTATIGDITIAVPAEWSVVQLSEETPCPPVQSRTVVIATDGRGGDCRSSKVSDQQIWLSTLNPMEAAPPTTIAVGNTTGWARDLGSSSNSWIVALPQSKIQINFTGPINEATRNSVIASVKKAS